MEYLRKNFCWLCLNSNVEDLKEIDHVTRDALKVIPIKLNSLDGGKHLLCDDCSMKLHAAFEFKSRCISVDTDIPCVDLKNELIEVNTGRYVSISDDRKICRLCMQLVNDFISVHEVDISIFEKYIPEVNFGATKEPVICKLCLDSLITHNCFIKNCLHVDNNIEDLLKETCLCIKSEDKEQQETKEFVFLEIQDIERKLVEMGNVQEFIKTEQVDIKSDVEDESFESPYNCCCMEKIPCRLHKHSIKHVDPFKIKWYECNLCSFKSKHRSSFSRHLAEQHKYNSNIQWYKCDTCSYKSKYKCNLNQHSSKHKGFSDVRLCECHLCDYKSNKEITLKSHMLTHKNTSEIKWFKCNECNYKSKWKTNLNKHSIQHKDNSKIRWYKCDTCSYKSKHKQGLSSHSIQHKDSQKIEWYECDKCSYKAKDKYCLRKHVMKHNDTSDVQWYECDVCSFKSKHKFSFNRHLMKHQEPSKIKWHECDQCGYKSKHKYDLKNHLTKHKEAQ